MSRGELEARLVGAVRAIQELNPLEAREKLEGLSSEHALVSVLRARMALLLGDCEGALGLLTATGTAMDAAGELRQVAEGCARAMAGAPMVTDEARRVWVRVQNPRDRVLVPLIAEVAERAAEALSKHLNVQLPRPIRIELVSDLTSLSLLTGLPLQAAETTGTVAVARWGRVTMLSPRATREGYSWQDTLAHELAHLAISLLTRDEAPLWLQEGIAKREESRWRPRRPLDDAEQAHDVARRALREGTAIGLEQLGASIALQPSAQSASIAYAEVESFLSYWVEQNGDAALGLLLRDLRGLGSARLDSALVSVSGYTLGQWVRRWQSTLLEERAPKSALAASAPVATAPTMDLVRATRLAELLLARRHYATAAELLRQSPSEEPRMPSSSYRLGLALLKLGRLRAAEEALGQPESLSHLDGTWLSVYGRALEQQGRAELASTAFEQSLAFAPTLERVACRGDARLDHPEPSGAMALPDAEPWRNLCLDAHGAAAPFGSLPLE